MRISRRTVLLGAAGAGLLAAGGVGGSVLLGGDEAAAPLVPEATPGRLVRGTLAGASWWISLPPGVDGGVPVVVALHGRDGNAEGLLAAFGLDRFLAASGETFAVAGIDGGADGMWHPRADGQDPLRLVRDAFLPGLESRGLGIGGLLGWSMGGYGALLVDSLLDRKVPVCAVSPALFDDFAEVPEGLYDGADDFARWRIDARWDVPAELVRIDCGRDDALHPLARDFARARGIEFQERPGGHDLAYWQRELPAQLAWLGDRIE